MPARQLIPAVFSKIDQVLGLQTENLACAGVAPKIPYA